jgi:negative regulator of sigma E activity
MYPPLPLVVGPEPCYIDGTEAMCACQLVDAGRCVVADVAVSVEDLKEKHDTITYVEEPVVQPQPQQQQQQHPELVIEETQPPQPQPQQQYPELVIEEKQPYVETLQPEPVPETEQQY